MAMADEAVERTVARVGVAGHPYSSLLLPVPIVCFVGALLTDVAYQNSGGNLALKGSASAIQSFAVLEWIAKS